MMKWIGIGIIIIDVLSMIVLYSFINHKGVYKGDFFGLLVDSLQVIGLSIAIFLLGLILAIK